MSEPRKICKVQVSIAPSEEQAPVLVYNESKSFMWQGEIDMEIMFAMRGADKKFFYYSVDNTGRVHLEEEAPWQEW